MPRTRPTDPAPGPTDPAAGAAAPANRAARRGRAGKQPGTVHAGASGRTRAAQGRRVVPVRRTG